MRFYPVLLLALSICPAEACGLPPFFSQATVALDICPTIALHEHRLGEHDDDGTARPAFCFFADRRFRRASARRSRRRAAQQRI
jgi:hypothetical protein